MYIYYFFCICGLILKYYVIIKHKNIKHEVNSVMTEGKILFLIPEAPLGSQCWKCQVLVLP